MNLTSVVLLSVSLALDAVAVSATRGMAVKRVRARHVLLVCGCFGGAQALMAALGWFIGTQAGPYISGWDHWIAFALLTGIGAKMVWDAWCDSEDDGVAHTDPFAMSVILLLALATSIDALAAGIALPLLRAPLVLSIAAIGIVTGALSIAGLYAGNYFGKVLGKRFDAFGGLVLIGLGVMMLVEHLHGA